MELLTGDTNILNIAIVLQYIIVQPADFLFEVDSPEALMSGVAESVLTETVIAMPVDEVLTTGRLPIQERVKTETQAMLDRYRALKAERPWDWGHDWSLMPFFDVQMIPCRVAVPLSKVVNGRDELIHAALGEISPTEAMLRIVGSEPPAGTSVLDLSGESPEILTGPAPYVIHGSLFEHVLLVRGRSDRATQLFAGSRSEVLDAGGLSKVGPV